MHDLELVPERTLLVVIDIQERLAAAMPDEPREACIRNAVRLVSGAAALRLPVIYTEQYPKGLGPTVPPLAEALAAAGAARIEKTEFDAHTNAAFADALGKHEDRLTVVLCGMESHICVYQTARGLAGRDLAVHVAVDATCSRDPDNRIIARGLIARAGAFVTSTETVLFDLVGVGAGDAFKTISRLVR
jgi:nicotinamidase-related amidase